MSGSSGCPIPFTGEFVDTGERLRIGEVAARSGVSVRSLRYYEQQGLIASERTSGGHRIYRTDAVDRVRLVQALFAAGLTSRDAVEFMPCMTTGVATPQMVDRVVAQRDRLDDELRSLRRTRERLSAVLAATTANLGSPARV